MTRPKWTTCGTCGGSATIEVLRAVGSGIDGIRAEIEGQPVDLIPEPCPDCAFGEVPGDELTEAVAKAVDPFMVHPLEAHDAARAALIAARREEEN